ncbi:secretion protein EspV [Paracidovorax avenae]|uniref:secretion protein EspV n=1 Tax=Paracidovorax avenae TaxID=80867 RepID=UPI000D16B53A|nr:secretion protein EspV [Paracidovorax avenae]AVS64169.1 secretion protein EspV [Paracidovorax avenae]
MDIDTSSAIRQFLSQSLSNNRYASGEHLRVRAENYLAYIDAEKALIDRADVALQNVPSAASRQSAWMCHLERGVWREETGLLGTDRQRLAAEAEGSMVPAPSSPYARPRAWTVSPVAASALAMMIRGEEGPFTMEQSKTGFETLQESLLLASRLKHRERKSYRSAHRHDANRSETHPTKTPGGTDLSRDPGSRLRDEAGIPVMTGTSGSSSDIALATLYAAERAKLPWMAPGLDPQAGMDAMVDLSLQFFRTEGSSPSVAMARGMNRVRFDAGLPPKEVDAHQVFSHSYAEIDAGVRLTLEGVDPADEGAVVQSLGRLTSEAKARLDAARKGPLPSPSPDIGTGNS